MRAQPIISSFFMEVSIHLYSISGVCQLRKSVSSGHKMKTVIAEALATDLNKSVHLSMKAVSTLTNLNTGIYLPFVRLRELQYDSFFLGQSIVSFLFSRK